MKLHGSLAVGTSMFLLLYNLTFHLDSGYCGNDDLARWLMLCDVTFHFDSGYCGDNEKEEE